MRRKTRAKVKKGLIITSIVIAVILIIIAITFLIIKINQKKEISYDDGVTCKNYFTKITIDINSKEVKRDEIETTLKEEFNITEEQENQLYSSSDEMRKYLSNSVFNISEKGKNFTNENPNQTKS